VSIAAAVNDPGAASGAARQAVSLAHARALCGVPAGTPSRSSLRYPLSLPGSSTSVAMLTRTDS